MWKLVPALTVRHIMPCMNSTEPLEIYMLPGQMEEEAWPRSPTGLKVEEAMTSADINAELVCPLRTPNFPPGTHNYDPKRHDLIEGVSKCMNSRQEAQAKFNEFREALGSHDEVYTQTQGKKSFERVEITPSDIPNQAPTPRTKVLLDRSGSVGKRQSVVSPATKAAGDRPQRLSTTKWWRPLSFSGTLEG